MVKQEFPDDEKQDDWDADLMTPFATERIEDYIVLSMVLIILIVILIIY